LKLESVTHNLELKKLIKV